MRKHFVFFYFCGETGRENPKSRRLTLVYFIDFVYILFLNF